MMATFFGGSNPAGTNTDYVESVNGETGVVTLELTTDAEVEAIIAANDELRAMAPAVQALIDASAAVNKDRTLHTGDDPSTNVRMPNGTTLSEWYAVVQAFMANSSGSTSAPVLTADPTLSIGPQGEIQSGGYESTAAATTHNITFTATLTSGRFAWVAIWVSSSATVTSVVDSAAGSWTQAGSGTSGGGNTMRIYYRENIPAGLTGLVITPGASSHLSCFWQERDDVQTSSPYDVSTGTTYASGTSFTSGSTGATTGTGVAIGMVVTDDSSSAVFTPTAPLAVFSGTGIEGVGNIHNGTEGHVVMAAARTTANATTYAMAGTIDSSVSGRAYIAVFKTIAGGGAPVVGDTVDITPGAVTNGMGGDHTNEFKVVELDILTELQTEVAGTLHELDNGVSDSFIVPAQLYGNRFYAVQTPIDTLTRQRGNSKVTPLSGVVTGTLPTNSVAPDISPSGSQAVGQTHTVNTGTWANASYYGIQFYLAGVPTGARSTTTTFAGTNAHAGLTLTYDVIAYSGLGLPSASAVAGSNSVTFTGTAAVANTAVPIWPATIYFGAAADFTEATWTGTIDATRTWNFFRNSETAPYVTPPNTVSIHTPRAPAVVGDTLYIEETVTETATGDTFTARSAGKVITATPATLAIALTTAGAAGYTWIGGAGASAISQANPAVVTGGTAPYTALLSPAISGLTISMSGGSVIIAGTPANVTASTTYTVTVFDSAPTPATVTADIVATIVPVSVSSMASLSPSTASLAVSNNSGTYDGTTATQKSYAGNIVLGPVSDPGGSGIVVDLHRVYQAQSPISGGIRSEKLWINGNSLLTTGTGYWMAQAVRIKAGEGFPASGSDDEMLVWQTHTPASGDTQPDLALFMSGQTGNMRWRVAYSTTPSSGGVATTEGNPWITAGEAIPTADTWCKFIIYMRPGYTTAQAPRIDIWRKRSTDADYVQIVTNYTGFNTYNHTSPSYCRHGLYRYTGANWPASVVGLYYSKFYFQAGTNLYAEAKAALAGL